MALMHRGNIRRGGAATWCLTAAAFGTAFSVLAHAQQPAGIRGALEREAPAQAASTRGEGDPPSPAETMQVYRTIDEALRAGASALAAGAVDDVPGLGGVCIGVRMNGRLVGRGEMIAELGAQIPGSSAALITEAYRRATSDLASRLGIENDAFKDEAVQAAAARLTLSVELAGTLTPIEPETWSDAETSLAPGLEGVAARVLTPGGEVSAIRAVFPSEMLAKNQVPHRALGGIAAEVIGEGGAAAALERPKDMRSRHGVRLFRFRVSHLAQTSAGRAPVFLHRGWTVVQPGAMTIAELRSMADALGSHLLTRTRPTAPDTLRLRGSFDPISPSGSSDASAAEEALAALALLRYSEMLADSPRRGEFAAASASLTRGRSGSAPATDRAALMGAVISDIAMAERFRLEAVQSGGGPRWAISMLEGDLAAFLDAAPVAARSALALKVVLELEWAIRSSSPSERPEPAVVASRVAWGDGVLREIAGAEDGRLVGHTPWIVWAERELADFKKSIGGDGSISRVEVLRAMRAQVWDFQISPLDAADEPDLVGGIVFTRGATPLPTWQAARPLAAIATMLRDERMTQSEERPLELARLLTSLRFLRQLQVDEASGWLYPDMKSALGGVRAAPWDQSMPPDATSMTLLAVVETLKSLDRLAVQSPPAE